MRDDMAKVITECYRVGNRIPYRPFRKGAKKVDPESLPRREGMTRWLKGDGKAFGEHLAPLRRFLEKSVGRRWDKVYSEICSHLRPTSTIQKHVRDHLWDYVADRVRQV